MDIYVLVIAISAILILSYLIKPFVKKALTSKRDKALISANEANRLYIEAMSVDKTTLTPTELNILESKIKIYEKQMDEHNIIIEEKWLSDKMSSICFALLMVLNFIGVLIYFYIKTDSLKIMTDGSFYTYLASCICGAEILYTVYEETGLKGLGKFIKGKIGIKK